MPTRRTALLLAALLAASPLAASAGELARFSTAGFDAAKSAGGPVLIHVHAPWCPTCRAQEPILRKLLGDPAFASVKAFQIDYDSEKMEMRLVGAPDRSTVIVYKGGAEVGRSVGDVDAASLEALARKAL